MMNNQVSHALGHESSRLGISPIVLKWYREADLHANPASVALGAKS
jgi:hypothetical protein